MKLKLLTQEPTHEMTFIVTAKMTEQLGTCTDMYTDLSTDGSLTYSPS